MFLLISVRLTRNIYISIFLPVGYIFFFNCIYLFESYMQYRYLCDSDFQMYNLLSDNVENSVCVYIIYCYTPRYCM